MSNHLCWLFPYYNVISSLDLYVVLKWVFDVVDKECWVIDEIVVLWYAMFSRILTFELMNGMWNFDVVTLRWCLGLVSGIGHNSCIAPSIIRGLLKGEVLKVKKE